MQPTSAPRERLRFDPEALGQPQSWTVQHGGLQHTGEVVVAESVEPAWGRRLKEGIAFRLVFLTVPRRISPGLIKDPRVAMVVPRRTPLQARLTLDREIRAIRESMERYVTARDADAAALRRVMEERESSLRAELARRLATAYSQGRIYTQSRVQVRPRDIFGEETPESWADRLATALLAQIYPDQPIDPSAFPHALSEDEVPVLYRGLFQDDPDAGEVTGAFATGLGLALPESPAQFDASESRVLSIIGRELESSEGEARARDLIRVLTDDHGLMLPLAVLCLLSFVRHVRGEIELRPNHLVADRGGGTFLADRITWDLVPEVSFSSTTMEEFRVVRHRQTSPTWRTALPYATVLVAEMGPAETTQRVAAQQRRLMETLEAMRPSLILS